MFQATLNLGGSTSLYMLSMLEDVFGDGEWNLWLKNLSAIVIIFVYNFKISSDHVIIMAYKILPRIVSGMILIMPNQQGKVQIWRSLNPSVSLLAPSMDLLSAIAVSWLHLPPPPPDSVFLQVSLFLHCSYLTCTDWASLTPTSATYFPPAPCLISLHCKPDCWGLNCAPESSCLGNISQFLCRWLWRSDLWVVIKVAH